MWGVVDGKEEEGQRRREERGREDDRRRREGGLRVRIGVTQGQTNSPLSRMSLEAGYFLEGFHGMI